MTLLGATQSRALLPRDGSCSPRGAWPPLSSAEFFCSTWGWLLKTKLLFLPSASAKRGPRPRHKQAAGEEGNRAARL